MSTSTIPGAATLHRCELAVAALYRDRARDALARAREATAQGFVTVARGYQSEAACWKAFAEDWTRKAVSA